MTKLKKVVLAVAMGMAGMSAATVVNAASDEEIVRQLRWVEPARGGWATACLAAKAGALNDPRVKALCAGRTAGELVCKVGKACDKLGSKLYEQLKKR